MLKTDDMINADAANDGKGSSHDNRTNYILRLMQTSAAASQTVVQGLSSSSSFPQSSCGQQEQEQEAATITANLESNKNSNNNRYKPNTSTNSGTISGAQGADWGEPIERLNLRESDLKEGSSAKWFVVSGLGEEDIEPGDRQMRSCIRASNSEQRKTEESQSQQQQLKSATKRMEGLGSDRLFVVANDNNTENNDDSSNKPDTENRQSRLSLAQDLNCAPIKSFQLLDIDSESNCSDSSGSSGGSCSSSGNSNKKSAKPIGSVEWTTHTAIATSEAGDSLFRRAASKLYSPRPLSIKSRLVKTSIKATGSECSATQIEGSSGRSKVKQATSSRETQKSESLGQVIRSFVVGNFGFADSSSNKNNSRGRSPRSLSPVSFARWKKLPPRKDCKVEADEEHDSENCCVIDELLSSELEPLKKKEDHKSSGSSKHISHCVRTSFSCQSLIHNNQLGNSSAGVNLDRLKSITKASCANYSRQRDAQEASGSTCNENNNNDTLIMNHRSSNITTSSSPIIDSLTASGCLSLNKYVIEDKLLRKEKQKQPSKQAPEIPAGSRSENRRSTHCSSSTGATTFDSSISSTNNYSTTSHNTCNTMNTVNNQTSRDLNQGDRIPELPNDRNNNNNNNNNDSSNSSATNNDNSRRPFVENQCHISIDKPSSPSPPPIDGRLCEVKKSPLKKRENWDKNIEFLLAVIGFAVDLGNVWRFPYICYTNGGGAFLIPYTIMFILGGLPIFYLEMSLGQYFSSGCLTVWKRVCPMAKGIGYAMCVLNFFTGLYYNTIISWAVFFFVESFTSILPWTSCDNRWNSYDCKTIDQRQMTDLTQNATTSTVFLGQSDSTDPQDHFSSPTKDYFEREVLQLHLSTGIDDLGSIRKPLAIYLAIVFVCIYFAIWKGVKSTGKAVWITALLPYFVLIPLLIRGLFLPGAWLGIKYYLEPQWAKIADVNVWVEAAKQIYFSLGPGFGTLMALSSYNKFHHNCRRDALIAASVNYFASFIAGLVIFAVLGYMATIENVSINKVATEGPGLVFQVYPEGLATMRFSPMWSILFFAMVITLGIDSTFGGLESVITGLCDEYPRVLRAHRGPFIGLLIILIYLCSLPTTTYGGNYVIYVLESYGTSLSLLFIVLVETVFVCWIYGTERFCKNLEEMYGSRPGLYWRVCWKYISPSILLLIFLAACKGELSKYHTLTNGKYTYPGWAPTLGLLMTGSSVCCIPVYAIYYIKTKTYGSFIERLKMACKPIEADQKHEKDVYVEAAIDKIREDTNDNIHLDTVI